MAALAANIDKVSNRFRAFAHQVNSFSLPMTLLGGYGAKTVYEFERVANTVEAVTDITKAQREQLQSYVQTLNSAFPFTNTQIMQSALELGRAGFNFNQIMGALKSTLNLALAGNIELKESSDIATNVLTAMRLPMRTTEQVAQSLTRVNDVLSYAANQSNADVRQLGETFKYVGPMAAAAGLSVEEVAGMAMVMANNGIRASEAGVAMRSAIVRMVRPTREMMATLGRLNININDFITGGREMTAQNIVQGLAAGGIDAKAFEAQIDAALKDPALRGSLTGLQNKIIEIIGGGSAVDRDVLAASIMDTLTATGAKINLSGFMKALRDKGVGVGEMSRIFDVRQGGRLITLEIGADSVDAFVEKLHAAAVGSTDRAARIMQQGVVGAWARFHASIGAAAPLTDGPTLSAVPTVAGKVGDLSGVGSQMGSAGLEAMRAAWLAGIPGFISEMQSQLAAANLMVNVTPRLNMGALQGVHGDVGVDVSR